MGGQTRVEFLDWLRATAVLLVLLGHSIRPMAPGGAIGVSIFFVLSGYLIAGLLLRDGMLTPGNIAKFILRRVARIYPMYAFQICAVVFGLWLFNSPQLNDAISMLPGLFTFTSDYGTWIGYSFGVLWTLSVEFWFYVTFPFFLLVATRIGLTRVLLLGIAGSIAAKIGHTESLTLTYYDHFLIGALVASLAKREDLPELFKSNASRNTAIVIIVICASIPVTSRNLSWHIQSLTTALATAALICHWMLRPPVLSMPFVQGIGVISYSAYLLHAVVLDFIIKKSGAHPEHIPTFLAVTFGLSAITYFCIEKPIIALAHRHLKFSPPTNLAPQYAVS